MRVTPDATLSDVLLLEPAVFRDARGSFRELYNAERYERAGVPSSFRQDNLSRSARGVLRGLHLQYPRAQGKLVTVLEGAVFDVAVDVRRGSPTFGRWTGYMLSGENAHQLWVPPGFAHGFLVLEDDTFFSYKCTDVYSPAHELTVRWDDPAIGIRWPGEAPQLSDKDAGAPTLAELADRLPPFEATVAGVLS